MIELLSKLRYQCYIHACFGKYLENILLLFFLSFFRFLCEASEQCVSGRLDGDLVCPDGDSSCPTIRLIRPDVIGTCLDGRVFAISYMAPRPDVTYVPSGR
jgi:hypothetical protein